MIILHFASFFTLIFFTYHHCRSVTIFKAKWRTYIFISIIKVCFFKNTGKIIMKIKRSNYHKVSWLRKLSRDKLLTNFKRVVYIIITC